MGAKFEKGKFNLTPYYEVPALPTKGKAYPEGSRVFYRLYTMREAVEVQSMTKVYDLVRYALEGIKTEGMEKEDLFMADFLFVSLLRAGSSGAVTHFKVETTCVNCGEEMATEVPIESAYVDDLEELRRYVPIEGTNIQVVLEAQRVGRFLEAMSIQEREPGNEEIVYAAIPVVGVKQGNEEIGLSVSEAIELMSELPQYVVTENQEFFSSSAARAVVEAECPKCSFVNKVPITQEEGLALIKPFRKT